MVSSWVSEVSNKFAVICAKNQNDAYYFGVADIKVNYIVQGKESPCSDVKCPDHLECHFDARTQRPMCGCKLACPLANMNETFCGSDLVTYKSECHMHMATCKMYGNETMTKIQMAYPGECKG